MKPIKVLVESFADDNLTNAQMINAREIVSRLDPQRFHVTMFVLGSEVPKIGARPNTRLIKLPRRVQTVPILRQFLFGSHDILFYMKASPAGRWYLKLRPLQLRRSSLVATVESQSDWRDETIPAGARRLFEQTILRCEYLFSNSAMVQRSLQANYGLQSEIVRTGVDLEFFTPREHKPADSRPQVLFIGSLRNFKGPQVVLEAAERFPEADFVLVGDGVLREELQARSKSLPNVEMCGPLPRTEVRDRLSRADVFLFPSRWEGSPRVLLEAAASGVPAIARKDYEPESVVDGVTGFLVANDDEIMSSLARLLGDSELRRSMGKAARSHIASFSWDLITRQWEQVFTRLAAAQRTRGRR
jgi:glycosyltransferase involved in cell wall biosynthesis